MRHWRKKAGVIRRRALRAVAAWAALAVALVVFPAVPAFGQSLAQRNLVGLACGGLFPTGAFNDHVSQEAFGMALYYAKRAWRSPFLLGIELSYSDYSHVRRIEYLEGIPEVGVNVDTYNSIAQGLLFLRLQPLSGRVLAYVEALAGASYLWTQTTIGDYDDDGGDSLASETNFEDWTWAAGAGAGLSIRVDKGRIEASGQWHPWTFLEIKVRYMAGGRARYLKQGSIVVEGDGYSFTPERSATSFFTAQAGISFLF